MICVLGVAQKKSQNPGMNQKWTENQGGIQVLKLEQC